MRNIIKYYYNIDINDIRAEDGLYFVDDYILKEVNNSFDFNLYNYLIMNNVNVFPIIQNKDGNIFTEIDNKKYILLRNNKIGLCLNFDTINSFFIPMNIGNNKDWSLLWQNKIDYFEKTINKVVDKNILECFPYYIGMGELAIRIYRENNSMTTTGLSHYRLNNEFDFMCPDNIIVDYKVRDIAELLKYKFFNELDFNDIINSLFKTNLHPGDYIILYARLLFPTYFFDCIEKGGNISKIISKASLYESLLRRIYFMIKTRVDVPRIDWLIKTA